MKKGITYRKGLHVFTQYFFIFLSFFLILPSTEKAQPWYVSGQKADLMVSGAGFNNTGGALFFNHPTGVASEGTRLLVCDRFNNRVLIWNTLPSKWNSMPDLVLGQENFYANNPGKSKAQLNWPGNVSVSGTGVVAVADTENDRILLWKRFPISNAQPADLSIDLPSVTPQGYNRFEWPWGVWTDGTKLSAVATRGSAVLFWNSLPVTDNRKPDYILSSSMFGTPRNISTDGSTWFFVGDHNAKVTGMPGTFFWNSYPQSAGQPYDFYRDEWIKGTVLPDGKLIAGGLSRFYLWNKVPVSSTAPDLTIQLNLYKNGDGPDIAYAGGKLFVNNYNGNNVLVYNSVPTQANQPPDFAVGSITPATNTLDSIHYIQNPVIATDGKRLIATSDFDRSLWIWKTLPQKSGTAPDLKMSLTGIDLAPWDNALYNGKFVAAGKSKIAVWDNLPLNGELPDRIFNGKIGTAQFQEIKGVALDSLFIYVADQSGKIFVWNNLPVTGNEIPFSTIALSSVPPNHLNSDGKYLCAAVQGNPPAVYIYRVQDILSMSNPLPYKIVTSGPGIALNLPAEAATYGNALAIANTGNHSVLIWKDIHSVGQESPVILGQPVPPTYKAAIGDDRLFMPASLAFTDSTLWVGEVKFSSRILKFSVQKPLFSTLVSESSILVFPNPFSNRISAENTNGGEVFSLYDATGNIIWSGSDIDRHDFSFLGKGLYFLMINGNSPARQFIKLIKE